LRQAVSQNVLAPDEDLHAPNENANRMAMARTIRILIIIGLIAAKIVIENF